MLITNRKEYYSQDYILYEIVKQLKYRYLSIRKINKKDPKKYILSRYYMGYSLPLLKDSLRRNGVLLDNSSKIYFDLAEWIDANGNTPIFSFKKSIRDKQKKEFSGSPIKHDGKYLDLINSYPFAIDIDNKNLKIAWKEAKVIKDIFDKYELPYSLRFSGSKGFHFVIDSRFIELDKKVIDLPELFGKVVNNIMTDELLKSIDTSIYDARRVLKLAYSLCNNNGVEYICLPLDDKNFNSWKYEDMEMLKILPNPNIRIFKRGLLERNLNLTERQLKNNFLKFIEDYSK